MNKIKFYDYRVIKTIFEPSESIITKLEAISEDIDCSDEFKNSLSFSPIYPESDKKTFFILFDLQISDSDIVTEKAGIFSLKFVAHFKCESEISDDFRNSRFPIVNAPAIAYPYLRAFVCNYFVNAGYNAINLPTYNFVNSQK
ncbi:preprotein translocase subunit SecB [Volucribacter psittacicida]|uniref:Preprotein translocase subunit SecB n=1 Tax=Volucribacter psittacicida TaxID=203482 RepID=A0A4R1FYL4_9PAST|nr:protein-export chaperone SecB [Volucribacter psittacicida]TCJ98879.1 preprotein translocase subunit SecB [Volucribacter psittacicida]